MTQFLKQHPANRDNLRCSQGSLRLLFLGLGDRCGEHRPFVNVVRPLFAQSCRGRSRKRLDVVRSRSCQVVPIKTSDRINARRSPTVGLLCRWAAARAGKTRQACGAPRGRNEPLLHCAGTWLVTDPATNRALSNLRFGVRGVKKQGVSGPEKGRLFSFLSAARFLDKRCGGLCRKDRSEGGTHSARRSPADTSGFDARGSSGSFNW